MRISDWSSDVCSSDLHAGGAFWTSSGPLLPDSIRPGIRIPVSCRGREADSRKLPGDVPDRRRQVHRDRSFARRTSEIRRGAQRSEEHTSELQSLMRISYAVFCLKKKTKKYTNERRTTNRTK